MPTGFGSGSHSLTIFTAAGLKSDVGIWLFGNGSPVNGLRSGRPMPEKSPLRIAADGTRPERVRRPAPLVRALVRPEEERAVAHDRPAERAAVLRALQPVVDARA